MEPTFQKFRPNFVRPTAVTSPPIFRGPEITLEILPGFANAYVLTSPRWKGTRFRGLHWTFDDLPGTGAETPRLSTGTKLMRHGSSTTSSPLSSNNMSLFPTTVLHSEREHYFRK